MTEVFKEPVEYEQVLAWRLNAAIEAAQQPFTPENVERLVAAVLGIYYAIPSWAREKVDNKVGQSIPVALSRNLLLTEKQAVPEEPAKLYQNALTTLGAIVDVLEEAGLILQTRKIIYGYEEGE